MMKKALLLSGLIFSFTLFSGAAMAQSFSIEPGTVSMSVDPSEFDVIAHSVVVNNGSETTDFVWEREFVTISSGWENAICDKNQCHAFAVGTEEFTLAPAEEGTLDVHVYPFDNEGSAIILVHVWAADDPETVVTGSYYFNAAVSVPERLTENITIYPNPAENLIFIEQGSEQNVQRIELFSLSGKLVLNERVQSNNSVEVSSLPKGTYVARMFDGNDIQLSSNVVVKK